MRFLTKYFLARNIALVIMSVWLTIGLSSCGKKSALMPPDGSSYPKQYPRQ